MADYSREVRRVLKDHGCEPRRQGATSHEIWWSPRNNRTFSVPIRIKARHTANAILKQAGIEHKLP